MANAAVNRSNVIFRLANSLKNTVKLRNMSANAVKQYETLSVTVPKPAVYHVEINRPNQLNAMNHEMWLDFGKCFRDLHADPECRVVVLSGAGRLFTAGLDFKSALKNGEELAEAEDIARKAKIMHSTLTSYQQGLSQLELCCKPVLVGIHSACIGGGTSIITAADIRYCTKDAWFQIKEVLLGMAADVGVLQRMPKIIGSQSLFRELAFTGRKFTAEEALSSGLVSKVYEDKESMMKGLFEVAEDIAAKSPVAVQGTKRSIIYSRDNSVQAGLDNIAIWNQCMLQSEDFMNALVTLATKQDNVTFSKL